MALNVSGGHPTGVQLEDLIVEAVEAAGVLGHDPRLKAGVAIARQRHVDRPVDRS
jgi:hypothetical protein